MALYAFGVDPLFYHTQSAVTTSEDGITWSRLSAPFEVHEGCVSAAHNAVTGDWVASNGGGSLSHTVDPTTTWQSYTMLNTFTNLRKVISNNGRFIAVGTRKDPTTNQEVAVVQTSTSGEDELAWSINSLSEYDHSGLTDVIHLGGDQLMAVGYKSGMTNYLALRSLDNGVTWSELFFLGVSGPIWCGVVQGTQIWLGGQGVIFTNLNWSTGGTYRSSLPLRAMNKAKPITKITNVGTAVVACQSDQIWYTRTGYDWQSVRAEGYTFISAAQFESLVFLGVSSLLNQYTAFTTTNLATSNEPVTLTGVNIGVQVFEYLTV
jgi:hypothetical protein